MKVWILKNSSTELYVFKYKKDAVKKTKELGLIKDNGFYVIEKGDLSEFDYTIEDYKVREE